MIVLSSKLTAPVNVPPASGIFVAILVVFVAILVVFVLPEAFVKYLSSESLAK